MEKQFEWRKREAERISKERKVNKAAFLDSEFDKEMFLGNTFGHSKDLREEIKRPGEEKKE